METNVHFWAYLALFFLEWEMFQTKVVEKIKTHILCSVIFFRKSYRLWNNVEKCCTARQGTGDNIIRGVCCACWICKTTKTHPEYVIFIAFPRQQWLNKRASILRDTHIACLVVYLFFTSEERKPERLCVYWRTKWKFLVEVDSRGWGQFMCDSDCLSDPKNFILLPHRWEGAVYWVGTGEAGLGLGYLNPLNPELNPICYLLALLGAHHFLHVSRIRVKLLTFRPLMSYIYGASILDVSRSHTTTQHSR